MMLTFSGWVLEDADLSLCDDGLSHFVSNGGWQSLGSIALLLSRSWEIEGKDLTVHGLRNRVTYETKLMRQIMAPIDLNTSFERSLYKTSVTILKLDRRNSSYGS